MNTAVSTAPHSRTLPATGARQHAPIWRMVLSLALVGLAWLITTAVFWRGYVGSDDFFYARYAYLLHRLPINHWEFRIPAILAMRACFKVLGPTEIAAALPTLLTSLCMLAAVAWYVGWPAKLNWRTQLSVLLAATFPMDVALRSLPGANYFAAGIVALGAVCMLKRGRWTPYIGAALLSLAFATHEGMLWYIAAFCLAALAFDRRRFWKPVLTCVLISASLLAVECTTYKILLGHPLIRFQTAAAAATDLPLGYDPDLHMGGFRFWAWPVLENLVFSHVLGIYLILLLVTGLAFWKKLSLTDRILFVAMFAAWFWWSYGTSVPWVYKPFFRQVHGYGFLVFGTCILLPTTMGFLLRSRRTLAVGLIALAAAVHVALLTTAGHYGQNTVVARRLLAYSRQHPERQFLTDVGTWNELYVLGGFRLPPNVVCLNGPKLAELQINREPAGVPRYAFPKTSIDSVLVNLETLQQGKLEPEFVRYLEACPWPHTRIAPIGYRMAFAPVAHLIHPKPFMINNYGGEVLLKPANQRPSTIN